jgi:DNA-binding CsgD family transcriptional regulator
MGAPPARHSTTIAATAGRLVARDAELGSVERLLAQEDGAPAALVLEGEPGVGKTSLWEKGVELGIERGLRVLVARASGGEAKLPFAALVDLFDGVDADELASLPPPQLRALNVALYRADPTGPSQAQVVALSVLTALRALTSRHRLLVAIDDIQWLDRASEESLAYAARRSDPGAVTFLCARRPGRSSALEKAFPADRTERLSVRAMSLGATRLLLAERLGLRLTHHLLRRVYGATLGNPLFSIEVGRQLAGRNLLTLGEDVPVPDDVEDLLGMRVADLEGAVRRTLLALALDSDLSLSEVGRLVVSGTVEAATAEGVVVGDGDRLRASHPLLAAAAKRQSTALERQDLHRALADVVADEQRRALHLALATPEPDDRLAGRVAAAAEIAAARGATLMAAELATHAFRLTPLGSSSYVSHLLALGRYLGVAGEKRRLTELLSERVESLPSGAPRVAAYLLLTDGVIRDNADIRRLMEQALAEAGADDGLRAPVLAELAENQAVIEVVGIGQAEEWATEALARTRPDRPDHRRFALYTLSWIRALRGQPLTDLWERYQAVSEDRFFLAHSPQRVAGQRHVWRGELSEARDIVTSLQALAEERAEPSSFALLRLHLCELLLRIGDWDHAERLLDEWAASTDSELLHWPMYERCRALLGAGRGNLDDARRWGAEALKRADLTGIRWDWLETKRALGLAALLARNFEASARELQAVREHTSREGVRDPGAFPVAPDLVEALVECEAMTEARDVAAELVSLARSQDHPWATVGAQRCDAILDLAGAYSDRAATALEVAADAYRDLGLAFDHARTLLVLGRAQRRAKKWSAARENLQRAVAAFDSMASTGWAQDARSELARVGGGRPASSGRLTPTERRVAQLAVEGLSNKQIARALVVTVNTVEFHLRNTYAKLGVRSRVQLAGRLVDEPPDRAPDEAADPRP